MIAYILKHKNDERGAGNILAVYVVNDDTPPPAHIVKRLAAYGYELSKHVPGTPTNTTWDEMVREEVRIDYDLEPGEAWPGPGLTKA